jgi:hypothetical protein
MSLSFYIRLYSSVRIFGLVFFHKTLPLVHKGHHVNGFPTNIYICLVIDILMLFSAVGVIANLKEMLTFSK